MILEIKQKKIQDFYLKNMNVGELLYKFNKWLDLVDLHENTQTNYMKAINHYNHIEGKSVYNEFDWLWYEFHNSIKNKEVEEKLNYLYKQEKVGIKRS